MALYESPDLVDVTRPSSVQLRVAIEYRRRFILCITYLPGTPVVDFAKKMADYEYY